jgi:hypothetical protein
MFPVATGKLRWQEQPMKPVSWAECRQKRRRQASPLFFAGDLAREALTR